MLVPASNKILDDCDLGWCGRVFQLQVLDCFQFLAQKEQIWINDGLYTKFNRQSDSKDTGFGHSSEDVAAFKSPDVETFLATTGLYSSRPRTTSPTYQSLTLTEK